MKFPEFVKNASTPQPVYLLVTDQDYLKKKVFEFCREQVEEGARVFNWSVFDLQRDPLSGLLNACRTVPWMAKRRWVYVKNAELADKIFVDYLKDPVSSTVLILEAGKRPRSWPDLTAIEMPGNADPLRWVVARARAEGYEIDSRAAHALVELVGEDYQLLEVELEKLLLWALETKNITLEAVEEMTPQARSYDVFALIGAIAESDAARALRVLDRLCATGMTVPQILSMLYWNFRRVLVAREMLARGRPFQSILKELKIWSYRGREGEIRKYSPDILATVLVSLRQADRLCKTTSIEARFHLERVIVDTCTSRSI